MSQEVIVAIVSVVVATLLSVAGGVYTIVSNTKRFEIRENYYCELLSWYSRTNLIIKQIILGIENKCFYGDENREKRVRLLSELSSEIDYGRFYFPNELIGCYGNEKPSAYRGVKVEMLQILVDIYDYSKDSQGKEATEDLVELQRQYTSNLFNIINPRIRNKDLKRFVNKTIME